MEGAEDAGIVSYHRARGAAVVDLDLDGLLDLVVVNREEPVSVWRNVGSGDVDGSEPMGGWVAVRLRQPTTNVAAVGSWVEVRAGGRTQIHEVTVGGGHASGQLGWLHFGIGDADDAEVRVQWPDGEVGPWMELTSGEFAIIDARGDRANTVGSAGGTMTTTTATTRAVLADVELPDFGMPAAEPVLPPEIYADRIERLRRRMVARRYDQRRRVGRSRAQRQHLLPHRLRSTLRGGTARRRRRGGAGGPRRQRELRRGRSRAGPVALRALPGLQPPRSAP